VEKAFHRKIKPLWDHFCWFYPLKHNNLDNFVTYQTLTACLSKEKTGPALVSDHDLPISENDVTFHRSNYWHMVFCSQNIFDFMGLFAVY